MKKQIFTLLTLLVTCVTGAWATDVTFGFDEGNVNVAAFHSTNNNILTSGPISLIGHTTSAGKIISKDADNNQLKFQALTAITIYAGPSATITEVVITQTTTTRDFSIESGHGTISRSGSVVTWTGSRNSITLTNANSNAYVSSIKVTYTTNPDITGTTAIWDFQNGNPSTLADDAIGIEGKEQDVASSVATISMHVNAKTGAAYDGVKGKLNYRSANGDAQCNRGTVIQVPVKGTKDVVFFVPKNGTYTIAGGSETALATLYTATAADVAQGYVEIICSTSGYIYKISVSHYSVDLAPAKEYTSLCSTQALDFTGITDLEAYYISATSGTSATLSRIYQVPAGEGLLIKKINDGTISVPVIASASAITNKLTGVTTATTLADGDYILSNGKFVQVDLSGDAASQQLAAYKAYIASGDVAGARELELVFDNATAIERVANSQEQTANEQYYDLQGRKVAQPTKGLYIVNGKKIIIK